MRKVWRGQVNNTEGHWEGTRGDTVDESPNEPELEVTAYSIDICRLVIVAGLPRTIETLIAIFVNGIDGFTSRIVPSPLVQVVGKGDLGYDETHYVEAASNSHYGWA